MKNLAQKLLTVSMAACLCCSSVTSMAAPMNFSDSKAAEAQTFRSPKVLLTITDRIWNSSKEIQFYVSYVVDDANGIILEVKDAYVCSTGSKVKEFSDVDVYLNSNGSYANISCRYVTLDGREKTALIQVRP